MFKVVGESDARARRRRAAGTAWFDGARVSLVARAARSSTPGRAARSGAGAGSSSQGQGLTVRAYAVESFRGRAASTEMYGGAHASQARAATRTGSRSRRATCATDPAYFEVEVARDAAPGA